MEELYYLPQIPDSDDTGIWGDGQLRSESGACSDSLISY